MCKIIKSVFYRTSLYQHEQQPAERKLCCGIKKGSVDGLDVQGEGKAVCLTCGTVVTDRLEIFPKARQRDRHVL